MCRKTTLNGKTERQVEMLLQMLRSTMRRHEDQRLEKEATRDDEREREEKEGRREKKTSPAEKKLQRKNQECVCAVSGWRLFQTEIQSMIRNHSLRCLLFIIISRRH